MNNSFCSALLAAALASAAGQAHAQRSTPVTVQNTPSVEVVNEVAVAPPPLRPVYLRHFQQFDELANLTHRFPIAAGDTLQIEHVSIACGPTRTPMGAMIIGRTDVPGRSYASLWLTFEDTGLVRFRDNTYATHAVTYYVHGGDELEFRILADAPGNNVCTLGAVGHLVETAP